MPPFPATLYSRIEGSMMFLEEQLMKTDGEVVRRKEDQ
jgi:hypothetical protein